MDGTKVCPRCRGEVVVDVVKKEVKQEVKQGVNQEKAGQTFTSYATGRCRNCGATFDEGELLRLEGTGPVGG
jgi:hypothetical protein